MGFIVSRPLRHCNIDRVQKCQNCRASQCAVCTGRSGLRRRESCLQFQTVWSALRGDCRAANLPVGHSCAPPLRRTQNRGCGHAYETPKFPAKICNPSARLVGRPRTAPLVTSPTQPNACRMLACISPMSAPRPGGSSMSSKTTTRGSGMVRM